MVEFEFDFLGKDSIRYHNFVPVEKRVFKNLKLFKENKKAGDDLFDRLTVSGGVEWTSPVGRIAILMDPLH